MRANTDRIAGVRLVTDHPAQPAVTSVPTDGNVEHLDFETDVPALELVALRGRINSGLAVQLLCDVAHGRTFITLDVNGETETFEVPADRANDAFEHPFAYGGTLL